MKSIAFEAYFEGAVSVEKGDGWLRAWRLPHEQAALFPSPENGLLDRAVAGSGVRLRFETDARNIRVETKPMDRHGSSNGNVFDVTIDGELVAAGSAGCGDESVSIDGIPAGTKTIELWLPPAIPLLVRRVLIDDGARAEAVPDTRKKWVTYGSSLTHCVRAHSPSRIWPAIVARKHHLNLTCLGFGGQCQLDPMVGIVIRDLPADFISLKLGINCYGGGTLSPRTFPAAVIGLVKTIREKHPATPLALISPIASPPRETVKNIVGLSLCAMREIIQDVRERFVRMGDDNLFYFDGLKVFGEDEIARYAPDDQVHPNGDGIELMAENFDRTVMQSLEF